MAKRGARGWESARQRWTLFLRDGFHTKWGRVSPTAALIFWAIALFLVEGLLRFVGADSFFGVPRVPLIEADEDAALFSGRLIIFAASAGRGGSGYLRAVLACGSGVLARHEPAPRMAGADLAATLLRGERMKTLASRRERKMQAIRAVLEGTPGDVSYAETTHMFVKTFADAVLPPLVSAGAKVVIVVPHRPLADTIVSQLRLGWFSPGHAGQGVWYYAAGDLTPEERLLNVSASGPIASAVSYNADVEARTEKLRTDVEREPRDEWKNVRFVDVDLQSISPGNTVGIGEFLKKVGLFPVNERIRLLKASDGNLREEKKDRANIEISEQDVQQKISEMRNLFSSRDA